MTFRGKMWHRDCNHYTLVGTRIRVYQWNAGKAASFAVEILGLPLSQQSTFSIHGTGEAARDLAISTALEYANTGKYNALPV